MAAATAHTAPSPGAARRRIGDNPQERIRHQVGAVGNEAVAVGRGQDRGIELVSLHRALTIRQVIPGIDVEAIRKEPEATSPPAEKVSTSVDLPMSHDSKLILAHAAEEAEALGHKHIGTGHMLLAFLRDEGSECAQLLKRHG